MSRPAGLVDGLLAGRYRLASLLGSGAHGEVWQARDERLDRDVAVKVLRPELAEDVTVRARFRAEARHAGRLRHPGVAAVFDFAEQDDGAWLVMELVDGHPLSEVLRRDGRLTVDGTLDVVEQAAAALQAAHDSGIVHRDVKPGNLLLRADGRLSVTDFGIARATDEAALTRTGQVVGTAAYLSPEQARGAPVTAATDLYALGVVAYECLSGARPFVRDDPVAVLLAHLQEPPPPLPADLPRPVVDLVHRLMAKDPADRPASARQVQQDAAALRRALSPSASAPAPTAVLPVPGAQESPVPADPRTAPLSLAARPGQRRAVRATAVALALLALALGVRDAVGDGSTAPGDGQPERPSSSAPPAPAVTQQAPAVQEQDGQQPQDAPVVVPPDELAPEQREQRQDPAEEQRGEQEEQSEQEREQAEEQQQLEELRKEQEKQAEEQRKEQEEGQREQEREQEREREDQGRGGGG